MLGRKMKILISSYVMVGVVLVCWFVSYPYVSGDLSGPTMDVWGEDYQMTELNTQSQGQLVAN